MTTPSADCKPTGEFAASGGYTAELEPRSLSTTDAARSGVGGRLEPFKAEGVTVHHCDCMELMRATPDGAFDLAIVDPPYGAGDTIFDTSKVVANKTTQHAPKEWNNVVPESAYWLELFRVAKNVIAWGGNYFSPHLPPSRGWIVWDKKYQGMHSFASAELAFSTFDRNVEMFSYRKPESKEHPCQKPVALYSWLLAKYAKPGQRVLDTHFGSGSIAIAARNFGCELVACEIDAEYFTAATARIARDFSQQMLSLGGGAEPVGEQLDAFEHSGAQRYNNTIS